MRRSLPILASLLLLQGCYDDLSDIQQFMNTVKASTPAKIPPLPEVKQFVHISYKSADSRSPFSASPKAPTLRRKRSWVSPMPSSEIPT